MTGNDHKIKAQIKAVSALTKKVQQMKKNIEETVLLGCEIHYTVSSLDNAKSKGEAREAAWKYIKV